MNPPIILASTSTRRHELLARLDWSFTTRSVEIDEHVDVNEKPHDYIMRMVRSKAKAARTQANCELILTADTIGVMDDEILTKPADKSHAFAMWDRLSDHHHEIWTAVCASLVEQGTIIHQKTIKVTTQVHFIRLTDEKKERYWATGEPSDKAGAYAIQGGAMSWVRAIHGSYTNVVGLPLAETAELICESLDVASQWGSCMTNPKSHGFIP